MLQRYIELIQLMKQNSVCTKSQLAQQYGVAYGTFSKWIKEIPNLSLGPGQRVLTPKQIEIITLHLGEP